MPDNTKSNGFEKMILARILSVGGIAIVSLWIGILITQNWDAWSGPARISLGFGVAVALGALGEYLRGTRVSWLGTCFLVSGYAMAYFFSYAAHYVEPLQVFADPMTSWLLMTLVAVICTVHSMWNRTLAWFAAPGVLAMAGHVLYRGLTQSGSIDFGGLELQLSAVASIGSVIWCTILTLFYKQREKAIGTPQGEEEKAQWWLYRISHELYFLLAAASAVALPFFCQVVDQLPLCWAVEGAILLALSWREGAVFKHVVVIAMYIGAGVLLHTQLQAGTATGLSCFALATVAIASGIAYRTLYKRSAMPKDLSILGYCITTYGGLIVGTVSAFWLLSWDALPWIVALWASIFLMGVGFRDVAMYRLFYPYSVMTLGFFAVAPSMWTFGLVGILALALFGLSRLYERINELGGWMQDEEYLKAWPNQVYRNGWSYNYEVVNVDEAKGLSVIAGILAHVVVLAGVGVLMPGHLMAIGWSLAAVALTAYGLASDRIGHWAGALVPLVFALGRLLIHDLGHLSTNHFNIGFAVTGVCFLAIAAMHAYTHRQLNSSGNE